VGELEGSRGEENLSWRGIGKGAELRVLRVSAQLLNSLGVVYVQLDGMGKE